jgi:hypothetical protein
MSGCTSAKFPLRHHNRNDHLANLLKITRPPTLVEKWLGGAVKPEQGEPTFAGYSSEPV